MSWKSFVTASLFCVLATPVFAQPKLQIRNNGLDPVTGEWIWLVRLAPNAVGDALSTELGFKQSTGNGLSKVSIQSDAVVTSTGNAALDRVWMFNNPGFPATGIWGWETPSGIPAYPEGLQAKFTGASDAGCPAGCTGTVVNSVANSGDPTTAVNTAANEIFSAMGGNVLVAGDLSTGPALATLMGTAQTGLASSVKYLEIRTKSPSTTGSLTSQIWLTGSHDGANKSGRVADVNGASYTNYKGFGGATAVNGTTAAQITVFTGDINLDNFVDNADFNIFVGKYEPLVAKTGGWVIGDFNGDGFVDNADFNIFVGTYEPLVTKAGSYTPLIISAATADTGPGAGSGLGGGAAVPEPASIALIGLALLGSLGLIRRKR